MFQQRCYYYLINAHPERSPLHMGSQPGLQYEFYKLPRDPIRAGLAEA